MKKKSYVIIEPDGTTCPRCGHEAQTRRHAHLSEKVLRQPYYYLFWYNCINPECKTTIFMLDECKVWNKNEAAQNLKTVQEAQKLDDSISEMLY